MRPVRSTVLALLAVISSAALAQDDAGTAVVSTRRVEGFSLEGTTAVFTRVGSDLRQAEVTALGESGRLNLTFTWRAARLVAVRVMHYDYGTSIAALPPGQPPPLDVVEDLEVTDADTKAPKLRSKGKPASLENSEMKARWAELQAQARSFLRLANTPNPSPEAWCRCKKEWDVECKSFTCTP